MKMALSKLEKFFHINKLVFHSLDLCLYQASVVVGEDEYLVCDDKENLIRAHSLIDIQRLCRKIKADQQVLRHESAYDEMVGAPSKGEGNALEVPIRDNGYY
ncbi:DUF6482 family protein [Enterovibrio coralii]|uniref:Na(+)-translocating NADH-quinone reductase subunit B n=1 Tax=Enterovibrio coralii TaxID=294935 RepID=A0A135IDB2_9GAMM|nr:DUF6482 family protein [Enterovibrio coralii]KXF83429.1 hypothetical protein ATN88_07230 [Enterovibrio coralii]